MINFTYSLSFSWDIHQMLRTLKLLNITTFLLFSSLGEGKHLKGSVFSPLFQWYTEEKIEGVGGEII